MSAQGLDRLRAAATDVAALVPALADRSLTSVQRRRAMEDARQALSELESAIDDLAPVDAPERGGALGSGGDDPLARLSGTNAALEKSKAELQAAVQDARACGASWRRIGEALGIAPQSAHKRFDPRARRRHAAYMRDRYRPA